MVQLPCVSGCSNSCGVPSSGPCVTGAPARARGHNTGGMLPPVSTRMRAAGRGCMPGLGGSGLAWGGSLPAALVALGWRSVVLRGRGGARGRAVWCAVCRDVLHPSSPPGGASGALWLGVARCSWALGAAAWVAQPPPGGVRVGAAGVRGVSRSRVTRGLCSRACLGVARRGRGPRAPGGTPPRVSTAAVAHHRAGCVCQHAGQEQRSRSSGGASSLHVLMRRRLGGGLLRLGGSWPAWASTAGR